MHQSRSAPGRITAVLLAGAVSAAGCAGAGTTAPTSRPTAAPASSAAAPATGGTAAYPASVAPATPSAAPSPSASPGPGEVVRAALSGLSRLAYRARTTVDKEVVLDLEQAAPDRLHEWNRLLRTEKITVGEASWDREGAGPWLVAVSPVERPDFWDLVSDADPKAWTATPGSAGKVSYRARVALEQGQATYTVTLDRRARPLTQVMSVDDGSGSRSVVSVAFSYPASLRVEAPSGTRPASPDGVAARAEARAALDRLAAAARAETTLNAGEVWNTVEYLPPDRRRITTPDGGQSIVIGSRAWVLDPATGAWKVTPEVPPVIDSLSQALVDFTEQDFSASAAGQGRVLTASHGSDRIRITLDPQGRVTEIVQTILSVETTTQVTYPPITIERPA